MQKLYSFLLVAITCCTATAMGLKPAVPSAFQSASQSLSLSVPARATADTDYTTWESFGTCTLQGSFLSDVLMNLNGNNDGGDEITFAETSEVMVRHLVSDPNTVQYKFIKLFGYTDCIATIDAVTGLGTIPRTVTTIPVPWRLAAYEGSTSIDFMCRGLSFSPARKIFEFSDSWFMFNENYGYNGYFRGFLPDANPNTGIELVFESGGLRSTDSGISFSMNLTDVDHVRYITHFNDSFSYTDLLSVIKGECEYKTANDKDIITISYDHGLGYYRVLTLAYDANDNYMSIYKINSVYPNVAPEGTWQPLGKGIWHHYGIPYYYYISDRDNYETTRYDFPEDKMQWEVDVEKRTDTDREIYRVVNPYSPSCALADTFDNLLKLMYPDEEERPAAFRTDDTYWFVVDVTEPGKFTIEYRRNGMNISYWTAQYFNGNDFKMDQATFADNRLHLPSAYSDYNDLVVEMPDASGGISDVIADCDRGSVEYFDLLGHRVVNPGKGLYIIRRGTETKKIIIK